MGNIYSIRSKTAKKQSVPDYLKPMKRRKGKKKSHKESSASKESTSKEGNTTEELKKNGKAFEKPAIDPRMSTATTHYLKDGDGDTTASFTEGGTTAGNAHSGPDKGHLWFKGRRYLNHSDKGARTNFMPNDQLEIDRIRVQQFILRWVFNGYFIAPVEEKLNRGIKALHVGFGPGMSSSHHMLDVALDYRNTHFSVVDVSDLLPDNFEEEARKIEQLIQMEDEDEYSKYAKECDDQSFAMELSVMQNLASPVPESSFASGTTSSQMTTFPKSSEADSAITFNSNPADKYGASSNPSNITATTEEHVRTSNSIMSTRTEDKNNGVTKRKIFENLDFHRAIVTEVGLPFEDNTFDFVKQNCFTSAFSLANWKSVLQEVIRVTKPGGYIQFIEVDYLVYQLPKEDKEFQAYLMKSTRQKVGMEPRMGQHLPSLLKAAGLVDVELKLVSIPLGSWGLDLGNLWEHNLEMFIEASSPLLCKVANLSSTEYKQRWRNIFDQAKNNKPFNNVYGVWGRKPADGEPVITDWSLCPLFT